MRTLAKRIYSKLGNNRDFSRFFEATGKNPEKGFFSSLLPLTNQIINYFKGGKDKSTPHLNRSTMLQYED